MPPRTLDHSGSLPDHGAPTDRGEARTSDLLEDVRIGRQETIAAHGTKRFEFDSKLSDDEDGASMDSTGIRKEGQGRHSRSSASPLLTSTDRIRSDGEPGPKSRAQKAGPVAWRDLPNKRQLFILTMIRLCEPLTQTSLQAYMFYQLRSFDPSLPDSTISVQAGVLQGCFTGAQCLTAMIWGKVSDSEWGGRKRVLLVGLTATCLFSVGFGFSRTFWQAAMFRFLGGAFNGNIGVIRTMLSEIIKEKKYQSRAFLLLPMCFNVGVIMGPIIGGVLADPVESYPNLFGADTFFGGKDGVWWMKRWPYALPNLMSAIFLFLAACGVFVGLEETLEALRHRPDPGRRIAKSLAALFRRLFNRRDPQYTALASDNDFPAHAHGPETYDLENRTPTTPIHPATPLTPFPKRRPTRKLPFRRIWTPNVLTTLLSHALLAFHIGTFNALWFIFLSTPRYDPSHPSSPPSPQRPPFHFTGGLGLHPQRIGQAMAVLGAIGITLQLLVYPAANARLGTLRCYRFFLPLFPLAYALVPYLALVHSASPPPAQSDGFLLWLALGVVLLLQVLGRTFALPSNTMLVNNCSPHPSVLGTMHGVAHSVGSFMRTVGPVVGGWVFGLGLRGGVVGGVWWGLAGMAALGAVASWWVREGDGHDVFLEGEADDGEEGGR